MKLIVGLGNPGSQYELTRHNTGFIILDFIAKDLNIGFKAGKGDWYGASGKINDEDFYLMKPLTFMNNTGLAVRDFLSKYSIPLKNILIILDDFQIPLGTIRIRQNGSDGGHNGLSSIIYHLNTLDVPRMRIGIGKNELINKQDYVNFVLSPFEKNESEVIKELLPVFKNCILSFISEDIKITMNTLNRNYIKDEDSPVLNPDIL